MSKLSFSELLFQQAAAGTALTNTTTATSLLTNLEKYVLPANFFEIGKKLRIEAGGRISTHSSPGTLTLDTRFGSIVVFNGGASPTLAASQTNVTWELLMDLICWTKGPTTAATLYGRGKLVTAGLTALIQLLPATSPAPGTGFDSGAAQTVDLFATWSVANAANSIRCDDYSIIALN